MDLNNSPLAYSGDYGDRNLRNSHFERIIWELQYRYVQNIYCESFPVHFVHINI